MEIGSLWTTVLGVALVVYMLVMIVIGYYSGKSADTAEDFLLAGRQLPWSLGSMTLLATWFGAGTLLSVTDEVASEGLMPAITDPIGAGICLMLAGWWLARPLWLMGIITVSDFFQRRFGIAAEKLSAAILVPSFFGWIAAQFVALAIVLNTLFAIPVPVGISLVMVAGTVYTLLGGMRAVVATDAIQLAIILVGLVLLMISVIWHTGWDTISPAMMAAVPSSFDWSRFTLALNALAIGSLGNLPTQDLFQRILSVRTADGAQRACWMAGAGYLLFGIVPVSLGLLAAHLFPGTDAVLMGFARRNLNGPLMVIFILAVVSAVLSTIDSALLAPAGVMAQNLTPARLRNRIGTVRTNRICVLIVSLLSLATAYAGRSAFELLEAAYEVTLVGLLVPLLGGLWWKRPGPVAAVAAMVGGTLLLLTHLVMGWDDWFLGGIESGFARFNFPSSIAMTMVSALLFVVIGSLFPCSTHQDKTSCQSAEEGT